MESQLIGENKGDNAQIPPDSMEKESYPNYPQPPDRPPGAVADLTKRFKQTDKVMKLIVFGIIFMFIGTIFISIVSMGGGPNQWDEKYDKNDDGVIDEDKRNNYYKDLRLYDTVRDIGVLIGKIIINIGILILVLALFGGGLVNDDLDKYVRIGMIIAAGLIIGWSGMMI